MNIKEIEPLIIFESISGSRSYNLHNELSDTDIRGLFILPMKQRLSILDFDQEVGNDKQDIKYFEIKKYLKLASECNPNIIELLWMPKHCVKKQTPKMDLILKNRDLFITKKAFHTHSGYAFAQLEKCRGQNKLVHNPKPKTPPAKEDFCWVVADDIISGAKNPSKPPCKPVLLKDAQVDLSYCLAAQMEHVSNMYRLYKYPNQTKGVFRGDMLCCDSISFEDEFTKLVGFLIYNQGEYEKELKNWHNYWDWVRDRNPNRWKNVENKTADFDAKNMAHSFRLLFSGKNILKNGEPLVYFEGPMREFLMDIRNNKYEYDYLMAKVNDEMKELDELKEKSTLPYGANIASINDLYCELVADV